MLEAGLIIYVIILTTNIDLQKLTKHYYSLNNLLHYKFSYIKHIIKKWTDSHLRSGSLKH